MKVVIHLGAALELDEATSYYSAHAGASIADAFLTEFDRAITLIVEFPKIAASWRGMNRRLPLRRFPYSIVYRPSNDRIEIVAVAHQSRKPGYWRNRNFD
jgi:plasmid stabilization system protein ParE